MRVTAHPESVNRLGESFIVTEITHSNGLPAEGVKVSLGGSQGVFMGDGFTDDSGQLIVSWIAEERGFARITATATIGDVFLSDSTLPWNS